MTETSSPLLDPVRVGPYELPHRVAMAPLTRNRTRPDDLAPWALHEIYYAQRASAAVLIAEATQVSPRGIGYPNTPGIYTDAQQAGWKGVTEAVHERDGCIFLQLWHVGRVSHPDFQPDGDLPVSSSAVAPKGSVQTLQGKKPYETPRALETDEIPGVVAEYADGARRALEAGFDGVEIHAANGYLIDQFLRDGVNRRTDGYGGSVENRFRFLREVTEAVCDVWGGDRVGIRISPTSSFNDMTDSDPTATYSHAVGELNRFGLAYLHVVESLDRTPADDRITARLRRIFESSFIVNDGYDRETGEEAIRSGLADLVAYGRLFLANPDLPERFRTEAPLNEPHPQTFYGGDETGYLDYPKLPRVSSVHE